MALAEQVRRTALELARLLFRLASGLLLEARRALRSGWSRADLSGHQVAGAAGIVLGLSAVALAVVLAGPDYEAGVSGKPGPHTVTGEVRRPVETISIAEISPDPNTYGAGITVRIRFTRPVPKGARVAITDRINISASKEIGPAGWAWAEPTMAIYRPRDFWPGHTKVTITTKPAQGPVAQVETTPTPTTPQTPTPTTPQTPTPTALQTPTPITTPATTPAPGSAAPSAQRLVNTTLIMWAGRADQSFQIGRSQVITVVSKTHRASVVRDGKLIRIMKTSLGKAGWETRSGIKLMTERFKVKTMTSGSIGAEDNYSLDVPYAIRLTNSGEFIHAAPWAVGRIGVANGSHGCTNLLMDDAKWLFENALFGDPVITRGTGRKMEISNGLGGPWNVSWKKWQSGWAGA